MVISNLYTQKNRENPLEYEKITSLQNSDDHHSIKAIECQQVSG